MHSFTVEIPSQYFNYLNISKPLFLKYRPEFFVHVFIFLIRYLCEVLGFTHTWKTHARPHHFTKWIDLGS